MESECEMNNILPILAHYQTHWFVDVDFDSLLITVVNVPSLMVMVVDFFRTDTHEHLVMSPPSQCFTSSYHSGQNIPDPSGSKGSVVLFVRHFWI